ncbi:hypothetical protein [Bradyrhizobium sp. WSM471]|uniref:hypothetical protein n=1 Tax=Bradyrhizobium sp. WSM471 TaxID=319017 RepID=UPI0012F9CD7D|nr:MULTISPECIES: hypothetical protein [Bradyrhizobium]UFW42336.1 hypothetical protein BcanWSM471_03770 [Bradyrhizobium canariense]
MQIEPVALECRLDAGAELRAASLERVVDLLDIDSAVLYWRNARSQLNELAGGSLWIGKGRSVTCFIAGIKTSSAYAWLDLPAT